MTNDITPKAGIIISTENTSDGNVIINFDANTDIDPKELTKAFVEYPALLSSAVLREYFTSEYFTEHCVDFKKRFYAEIETMKEQSKDNEIVDAEFEEINSNGNTTA